MSQTYLRSFSFFFFSLSFAFFIPGFHFSETGRNNLFVHRSCVYACVHFFYSRPRFSLIILPNFLSIGSRGRPVRMKRFKRNVFSLKLSVTRPNGLTLCAHKSTSKLSPLRSSRRRSDKKNRVANSVNSKTALPKFARVTKEKNKQNEFEAPSSIS